MDLIQSLQWRYATKKMDSTKAVSQDKVDRILEAVRLAPTSSGLQPYEVLVVTNREVRQKIKSIAHEQGQVLDCSHLLVFAAWNDYTPERINMMFDLTNEEGGFVSEDLEGYRKLLLSRYPNRGAEVNFQHAAKQAYIGLCTALIAASLEQVDSTPMEGFDPDALDELLNLRSRGLRSVLMLPLGYRETDKDWLVSLKKVRRSRENFVTEIK